MDKKPSDDNLQNLSSNPNAVYFLSQPENHHLIYWPALCANPAAGDFLYDQSAIDNPHIEWEELSTNPSPEALTIFRKYKKRVFWKKVLNKNTNPKAVDLAASIIPDDEWVWHGLSKNPDGAAHLFREHRYDQRLIEVMRDLEEEEICTNLCKGTKSIGIKFVEEFHSDMLTNDSVKQSINSNSSDYAIELLRRRPELVTPEICGNKNKKAVELFHIIRHNYDWELLSENPNAIDLLEEYPSKIDHGRLCSNPNPKTAQFYVGHEDDIVWWRLCRNESLFKLVSLDFLVNNIGQWDRSQLCANPSIFEKDKRLAQKWMQPIAQEVVGKIMHPDNVFKSIKKFKYDPRDDENVSEDNFHGV